MFFKKRKKTRIYLIDLYIYIFLVKKNQKISKPDLRVRFFFLINFKIIFLIINDLKR
jgi:hypothetical protein